LAVSSRGFRAHKNPPASAGPVELITLNMLEGYDLRGFKHNSADYIHVSAEALKLAMADREKYLGDMDFVKIPYEGLLSNAYARERRGLIDMSRASLELRPGTPEKFMRSTEAARRDVRVHLEGDADH